MMSDPTQVRFGREAEVECNPVQPRPASSVLDESCGGARKLTEQCEFLGSTNDDDTSVTILFPKLSRKTASLNKDGE